MRSKQAALASIAALNRLPLDADDEKPLEVRLAVSKLQRERKLIKAPSIRGDVHHFIPPNGAITPKSGPAGCNVFVFHAPPDWTEFHLRQYFSNYGFLLSATIIRDKLSLASKGFGFVSYDNPYSAQSCVLHMNGFMVGGKRLKVQIKRGDEPVYTAGG